MSAVHHRVLVIDDEPLARRRLRQLLSSAPDFAIVGESDDAREAAALVQSCAPDVVFLDIQMPHVDGFAVQAALREHVAHVVFVTAHPEHAARAFDVAATDYLVKPVTQARFDDMLNRLRRSSADGVRRILLGGRLGGAAVAVADVVWLQANGSYVTVHTAQRDYVVRESLARLLSRLGAAQFVRIHRSAGIGIAHIRALRRTSSGLLVQLSSGARLPISRRKAREVVELLRMAPPAGRSQQQRTAPDRAG